MEPITFENGMLVKLTGLVRNWDGEGPYKVVKVVGVSRRCNCGAGADDDSLLRPPHEEFCNTLTARHVGHHQFVTVQIRDKKVEFSGAWLVVA